MQETSTQPLQKLLSHIRKYSLYSDSPERFNSHRCSTRSRQLSSEIVLCLRRLVIARPWTTDIRNIRFCHVERSNSIGMAERCPTWCWREGSAGNRCWMSGLHCHIFGGIRFVTIIRHGSIQRWKSLLLDAYGSHTNWYWRWPCQCDGNAEPSRCKR